MPFFTESELKKNIKTRQFLPVYLIYGCEQMYVSGYTKKLVEAAAGKNPSDFNFHSFTGDIDLEDFAASLQIVPFLSEYNCVLLSDLHFDNMTADELDSFKQITSKVYDGTVLIISMPTYRPSKNKKDFEKLVKRVEKLGAVCNFEKLDDRTVRKHIAKFVNDNGKIISEVNARKLMSLCGSDLNLLKNEVDKICAYSQTEEITLDDINAAASVTNLEEKVFSFSDAVINGNGQRAFDILDRLIYQKEEPIMLLSLLAASYVDAYRMRVADECGVSQNDVAKDFDYKKRAFALGKAKTATRKLSTEALRKSIDCIFQTDFCLKTASVNSRIKLEQLISQLMLISREDSRK